MQLYKVLPTAINDHLKTVERNHDIIEHSAFSEIKEDADLAKRNILDQITFENYPYYKGADRL